MWKSKFLAATLLLSVLLSTLFQIPSAYAQTQRGPRSPYLDLIFYTRPDICFTALQQGDIDIMAYPITDDLLYDAAVSDPDILLAPYTDSNQIYGFNFNSNETISTYGHEIASPLNNTNFRKALAYLIDKNRIISDAFDWFADRIDVPFPLSQKDWWNTSVTYPNYPYEFSWLEAEALLDASGFIDRDRDGWRNYPIGWPGREGGPNLDPIVLCVEWGMYNKPEYIMADILRDEMESLGIPVYWDELYLYDLYYTVLVDRNYHIFAGSQIVYRAPIWWYALAVLVFTFPFGSQHYTYPDFGEYLYIAKTIGQYVKLMDTLKTAVHGLDWDTVLLNIKKAQGIYVENAFEIPVCSLRSYIAYRKTLAGVVDEKGFGIDNPYTFLNAYRVDSLNQPIRVGLVSEPMRMNILYSGWQPDYMALDRIYAGLLNYNPYDTAVDNPWIARDWDIGTWIDEDDGQTKTTVTYYFRKDAYWVKPVTDERDGLFNATDYEFTCHYIYAQYPYVEGTMFGSPHHGKFKDIHHIETINDFTVKVYFNVSSMWAYQWPTYPLLPKHKWLREPLAHNRSVYIGHGIELPGMVPLSEYVVSGSKDTKIKVRLVNGVEAWLTYGQHFRWQKGGLYIMTDSVSGVKIDKILWVYYWANGDYWDVSAHYPGNLPWDDILEGCGTHHVYNIQVSSIALDANRDFFLETPILGEIDWRWSWEGTVKPRSGYYKIDILDVVKVTDAYCSRGDGIPPPEWNPGADIDQYDVGHIGIQDLIIVSSNYGKTFGRPPP